MAKKKTDAPAAKSKPAPRAKSSKPAKSAKASAASTPASPAPAAKKRAASSAAPVEVSNELIGYTAGEVWRVLSDGGVLTMPELKKAADAPAELVLLALGWLAREEKLDFQADGAETSIALR